MPRVIDITQAPARKQSQFQSLDPTQDHLGFKSKSVTGQEPSKGFNFKKGIEGVKKSLPGRVAGAVAGFGRGAAKSAITGTGATLSSIGERGIKGLGRILTPKKFEEKLGFARTEKTAGQQIRESEALKPKGTAEKVGAFAEKVGEFFIPGTAGLKLGKAALGARALKLGKAGSLALKTGVAATEAAGITALQTGSLKQGATAGAITGALVPGGAGAANLAKRLGNFAFTRVIPTTPIQAAKDIAKGISGRVGEQFAKTGISLTRKGFVKKSEQLVQSLGKELGASIDQAVKLTPRKFTAQQLTKGLKKEILDDPGVLKRLKATPIDLPKVEKVIDDTIRQYKKLIGIKKLDIKDVQKLKVMLGNGLESEFDRAVGATLKAKPITEITLRKRLKNVVEEAVPDAKELNQQMAPLLEGLKRLGKKAPSGNQLLSDLLVGGFVGGGADELFNNPQRFFKNALLGILLKRGVRGTAFKTISGTALRSAEKLADNKALIQSLRKLVQDEES